MLYTSGNDDQLVALADERIKLEDKMSSQHFAVVVGIVAGALAVVMVTLTALKAATSNIAATPLDWFSAAGSGVVFGLMSGVLIASTCEQHHRSAIATTEANILRLGQPSVFGQDRWGPSQQAVSANILRLADVAETNALTTRMLGFSVMSGMAYNVCFSVVGRDALTRWNMTSGDVRHMMDAYYNDAVIKMLFELLKEPDSAFSFTPGLAGFEMSSDGKDDDFVTLLQTISHAGRLADVPGSMDVLRTLVRDRRPDSRAEVLRMIDTSMLVLT